MKCLCGVILLLAALTVSAADVQRGTFSETLSPDQKAQLGLSTLTPAQLAALDAAVAAYANHAESAVVAAAEKTAAEKAVAEYKKKKEPGVIARSLDLFKRKAAEDQVEHFTARIVGTFRGWSGGTYFPLTTGQVWRQTSSDSYELPPTTDAAVEIYKSANGYWRLKVPDGAWVTVKRLQ